MEDITDLTADLDYECQANREFHNSLKPKLSNIDQNTTDIAQLRDELARLRNLFNASQADLEGDFKKRALNYIYPVGSVYVGFSDTNPSVFLGGVWSQITGRFLLACDSSHQVGTNGGEEFHKLTTEELPAHNHSATTDAKGKHTHTTSSSGSHTHTRGTMNITGYFGGNTDDGGWWSGAFYCRNMNNIGGANGTGDPSGFIGFDASRTWSGSTSSNGAHTHTLNTVADHTHTITVSNTGSSQAHNNMPPYTAVYMFRRIS